MTGDSRAERRSGDGGSDRYRIDWLTHPAANALLRGMFILVLLVTGLAIVSAFCYQQAAVMRITQIMTDARNAPAPVQDLLARLQGAAMSGIDSGSMQFLFEVFSGALVVVGVYLLDRAYDAVRDAEQAVHAAEQKVRESNAEQAAAVVRDRHAWHINSATLEVHMITVQMRGDTDGARIENLKPWVRTSMGELCRMLQDACDEEILLLKFQFDFALNQLGAAKKNFKLLEGGNGERREAMGEFLDLCDQCLALLLNLDPQNAGASNSALNPRSG